MAYSDYYYSLEPRLKARYLEKIGLLNGVDPYSILSEECSSDHELFPKVQYPDIVNYLVYTLSLYTLEQMNAYKSLEGYKMAISGWVKEIKVKNINNFCVVFGKVLHSQRLSEKPLAPWIVSEYNGVIKTAHCTCVAGFGSMCSHVAAILFCLDRIQQNLEPVSVTEKKAYWMLPSVRPTEPKRIAETDFVVPCKKFYKQSADNKGNQKKEETKPEMSESERNTFLEKLQGGGEQVATHLTTAPFSHNIKKSLEEKRKLYIMEKFNVEYTSKSLVELRNIAETIDLSISLDDCKKIEKDTKRQAKSRQWFLYRMGRITASLFKYCCRTDIDKPSISLIKRICYQDAYKLKSKAMHYGCKHEDKAIKQFEAIMKQKHTNFYYEKMGLVISPHYPYFGATPDGLLDCDCCGVSLLEIKCPYCARNSTVEQQAENKSFYLKLNTERKLMLKEDHIYYYQVQMQMGLTKLDKCHLVVWTPKSIEHLIIPFSPSFWERESAKAKNFFFKVIMPEVLGKYFTQQKGTEDITQAPTVSQDSEITYWDPEQNWESTSEESSNELNASSECAAIATDTPIYCFCQQPDDGKRPMIACESNSCEIEWFHLECIGLSSVPDELWYCPNCALNL